MKKRILTALLGALLLTTGLISTVFADGSAEYVVKPGDTLSKVARMYNTTANAIAIANGISNANFILPGEVLIIPIAHPHVLIDQPTNGSLEKGTVHVTGRSDTFEAVVNFRVLDRNFRMVGTGRAMGGAGTYGPFAADVAFNVPFAQVGYVEGFEVSAKDGSQIQTDTAIVLLSPRDATGVTRYMVRFGDTLYGIARRFRTTVQKLAQANNITNVNRIFAGQVLVIVR